MVEVNPQEFVQSGCYTAENFRQVFDGVVCVEGVTSESDLVVAAVGGASVNVTVSAGTAWVAGDLNGAEGMYFVTNDASKSVTIAANGAGSARIDRIIATVYDSQYIGAVDQWAIEVVQGTAGGGVPAVPNSTRSGWLELGQVTVPASGGTPSVVGSPANVMQTCGNGQQRAPYVSLISTGSTSIPHNTLTKVDLASTVHNDTTYFTVASSVVTVTKTGFYDISPFGFFATGVSGFYGFQVMKNGLVTTLSAGYGTGATGDFASSPVALQVPLTAGDTIQLAAKQNTGGGAQNAGGGTLVVRKVG